MCIRDRAYTIGRVIVNWNADAGKIYDVLVSSDGKDWKTVHRVQKEMCIRDRIFFVLGKSCSGKDTIFKKLKEDRPLNLNTVTGYTCLLYTSRCV